MAAGEEEELSDFEGCAECACAHGSSKRSFQFTVLAKARLGKPRLSWQPEQSENKEQES